MKLTAWPELLKRVSLVTCCSGQQPCQLKICPISDLSVTLQFKKPWPKGLMQIYKGWTFVYLFIHLLYLLMCITRLIRGDGWVLGLCSRPLSSEGRGGKRGGLQSSARLALGRKATVIFFFLLFY